MPASSFQFPVIGALVSRHSEDAAFYWSQLDWTLSSPQVGLERLCHFNRLLDAHMDGLKVAGPTGWATVFTALRRWQKPGEAFACMWLAIQHDDHEFLDEVMKALCKRPEQLLRGAISALAWSPREYTTSPLHRWSAPDADPAAQVAAIRAAALMGKTAIAQLESPLPTYFASNNPHVRAAACRAAVVADPVSTLVPLLHEAMTAPDLQVRAEAAIALAKLGGAPNALAVLLQCIVEQATLQSAATGWLRSQAARRLNRWIRELAYVTPIGISGTHELLLCLPPRTALMFTLYHGDLAHLPFIIRQMKDPKVSRYAGWVWSALTGIDLFTHSLTLPEPDPSTFDSSQLITEARLDADNGLPLPDHDAIHVFGNNNPTSFSEGKRVLLGQELLVEHALDLLETAPQAIRIVAAQMLNQAQSVVRVNVRSSTTEQQAAMDALEEVFADGVTA